MGIFKKVPLCFLSPRPLPTLSFLTRTTADFTRCDEHPLLVSTTKACVEAGFKPMAGIYALDTSAFFALDSSKKLGLGSSAAAIVALSKMILLQHGALHRDRLLTIALKAHRDFSQGLGSGADVAGSVFGGIIEYQNIPHGPLVQSVDLSWAWPNFLFIDTKQSQNTRDFIVKLDAAQLEPDFWQNSCRQQAN